MRPTEGRRELGRLHVLVSSLDLARAALAGGAPVIQVRRKGASDGELLALARAVTELCEEQGALCIVNDRPDVAVAAGAHGVHLGADDLPVPAARVVVGPDRIIGGTAREPETARRLVAEGADYLGVGPCYPTTSKDGLPDPGGAARVRAVASAVDVPVIAIAGVTVERVPELLAAGAHGVAVIGAVGHAVDPVAATKELLEAVHS